MDEDDTQHDVYYDGFLHVQKKMCSTCIFRPGNLMGLVEGRVEGMVRQATEVEGTIPCHQTFDGPSAVCSGFFNNHKHAILQIAERMGRVKFVQIKEVK